MGDMAYKNRHKALGLFQSCSRKVLHRGLCLTHYWNKLLCERKYYDLNFSNVRKTQDARRKRYAEEGRCRDCGVSLIEGEGVRCINCNTVSNNRVALGVFNEVDYSSIA